MQSFLRVMSIVLGKKIAYRLEGEEVDEKQYHQKSRRTDEGNRAEEERQSCDCFLSICTRNGKHDAEEGQRHTHDVKRRYALERKHVLWNAQSGEEQRKRSVNRNGKTYNRHYETQDEHDSACFHIGIRLGVLRLLFFHKR